SLNIDPNTEVYNVSSDEYPYQEQYYDNSESKTKLGKYKKRKQLRKSQEFWKKLMNEMLPKNPIIINVVNRIVNKIGGTNSFISAHARLGDGYFVKNQDQTVQELIKRIQEDFKNI
ncbi:16045_t:CDS:2, partial [Racocetra fulgida]